VAAGTNTATLKGYDASGIRAAIFSPDGKTLATVGCHDGIKLWEVAGGKNTAARKVDAHVSSAAFSSDGTTLATGGVGQKVRLWDVVAFEGTNK